ncbi:lysine-specific histone demethylase 1 homolog 3-like [Cucurbita maxima]|uniref:Lysine-specific histone demethylase 1 homolog 3-like n=1 Tax=Cucurbita maxima TaxID=3661 RepID=A0A6J1K8D1_CUCMA|nr:lysine-specific histone demethylase 1 homolog 3-like [Cucurbita maxima]XP_022997012.1 lysine-specific histone demethylase 1 homolog 3-like [Cucurbita maxima]
MDGDNKKSGFRKRTKPKEGGFDSDDDEPIGSLLKLKRSRNSKKSKLGVDDGGERDKMVDKKGAKHPEQEDIGGMDDTLASFRKKLRRPKEVGPRIARKQSSSVSVAESLVNASRGQGDLDARFRPEKGELMYREEFDSSAMIDVETKCEAPVLELKDMETGISSRRSAKCSFDKQLDDSLSAFVQKVQSGSTRKTFISTTFKPDCKDEASEDKLSPFSRTGDHETYSIMSSDSSAKLAQVVEKTDSDLTMSCLISCSRCTGENCNPNPDQGQCHQGVEGDQEEYQRRLNNQDSKIYSQFRDNFQGLERKASCEIKNALKHCSCGETMERSHLAEMVSLQDGLGENHLNENMCSSFRPLEQSKENHGLCGVVSSGYFCDVVAQETTVTLSKKTLGVDCEGKDRLLVMHHDELPTSTNFCENSSKEICRSTQNLKISDQSLDRTTLSNLQISAAFDSKEVDKTCSDSGNLNTGTDVPNTKGGSRQKENARISRSISDSTAVQCSRSQKSGATTSVPNYPEVCPIGNFSMISDNQQVKASVGIDGPNNILPGKDVKVSSPGSLTPDDTDLEDVISAPGSEKDLKLSALQRVARKTKKPRHDDMAYKGDIDWEILISERAVDGDHSFRSRRDSTSTTFTEAETGGRAAVSAGLKAHAVSLLEKIKFKDVLKRKGGLQEYLACRNQILGLWSKDVTRILNLVDCGVTNTPSMDEPPRFPLIREIYAFLNLRGYINAGIASEKAKSESDIKYEYELGEKKVGEITVASAADSEEGVCVIVKNSDASDAENNVAAGCELLLEDTEGRDLMIENNFELAKLVEHEQELVQDLEFGTRDPIPVKFVGIDVPGKAASHLTNHSRNGRHQIQSSDACVGGDQQQQSSSEVRKKVIVIGAGPAGLTAAKHLHRQGFTVIVLEARNRLGGRVYTDRSSLSVPVDLGASIITGVEADVATERRPDPSSLICTQLGLELTVLNSDCPLYDIITCKKVPVDMDEALEAEYNSLLDDMVLLVAQRGENAMAMSLEEGLEYALKRRRMARLGIDACSDKELLSPFERRVMNWHFANLEYGCAAMLKKVSLPNWNQDDLYGGFGGAHCMIKGGYSTVVESLGGGLNVHLNHAVADISYSTNGIELNENQSAKVKVSTTNGCVFLGDAVLITVPLGCLKEETIKFSPPLPEWKRLSIQRLGFGVLNKIVLEFPEVFWDDSVDYFGATAEETKWRGQCFMFWNVRKTVGAPVLMALVVGQAAVERQYISSSDNVSHALMVLRKLFGEAMVPDPVATVVTDWGRDPFSYGAYSYVAVGASGEDYDILARPVGNCLFFAGEATCKEHPDTVGGAMMSGIREAVRMIDILSYGYDFTAEVEAMEAAQRQFDCENDEVGDIITRLDAVKLSDALFKNSLDGSRIVTREALLKDLFFSAKTTAGRLHVAKELLNIPVETLKSFAGAKEGLTVLNSWILDSMGKDGTQLLRQCVRILVLVSTDLLAVRLSGIGKTVKEKVCVHTSRDIRAIASQLVSIWLEVFRKEKAANGGLKLSKSVSTVESLKRKSNKDSSSGKPPLHSNNCALDSRGNLPTSASAAIPSTSDVNMKSDNSKLKLEMENSSKSDISSSRSRGSFGKQDAEMEDNNIVMTEEEEAAFAAAEAARAAALAAAKAYASSEAKSAMQLPKIPSFHKFARREHYAQMDEYEYKRKLSGSVLGRQDCTSEIDSRNCRVRNWSVEFSAACVNLESSRMSADNLSQRSHSNEIVSQLNFREHSGESVPMDSSIYTKAWVDTAGSVGMKDYHAIERWRTQAAAAHVDDEEDSNTNWNNPTWNRDQVANESSISQVTISKEPIRNHQHGADRIKQAVVDYVASLLMPLYKARKIDKDGYKSIMKKSATKVMEQATDAEKGMTVSEFLDFKRRNKIRAFVDKLIERHMATKPVMKS